MKSLRKSLDRFFSPGALVILTFAIVTSVVVAWLPREEPEGVEYWVFHYIHYDAYKDRIARWNEERPERPFAMSLINGNVLERRMLSGFLSGTPMADLLEAHVGIAPKAFLGPIEQIGFLNLTERVHAEGLYEQLNTPSFSPWSSRGHIFGLPHDVHPAVLAYRADIVEAAGIDVSEIETWEDFFRVMRPLMADRDGDGRIDRFALCFSEFDRDAIIGLLLQNDGVFFDEDERPVFANARNARALATMITWITGPDQAAMHMAKHAASSLPQLLDGLVLAVPMGDVQLGIWKHDWPRLGGLMKVMPLPAWERGGRRTTVMGGGTMIGINRRSDHIEESWEMAKTLYTSREIAERTYRESMIVSPVKAFWTEDFYHEPDPFYSGQAPGSILVAAAPNVPTRPSSPYTQTAYSNISSALIDLRTYADRHQIYDIDQLEAEALRLLQKAQDKLSNLINRNVFLTAAETAVE